MPLLGRKVVPLVKPLSDLDPNETIYTIKHTQEQFRSKAEYEKRLASYADAVWTCQCSGHINLTHEDAYRSEQEKYTILRDQFPKYFEKTVLELVHHNTEILDTLVDQAWTKIQQAFAVGETVALKNKAQGKTIRGVVVKVDTSDVVNSPQKNGLPNGNCNSPSSDKENAASNNTETDTTPTKWVHPKLLEYKYNLKLEGDDKTISGIPAQDLQRVNRPPSKDLVKLFIRSHALRHGIHPNSPWAVNENHVKMYGLKSKYADFLVSPQKMADLTKKTVSGEKRKRQSGSKDIAPSAKRPKLNSKSPKQTQLTLKSPPDGTVKKRGRPPKSTNGTPVSSPKKAQTPKKTPQKSPQKGTQKTPTKRTPSKSKSADTEDSSSSDSSSESGSSDSSEDVALADLKNGKKPSSPNKLNAASPRKRSLADLKRDMEENTPLSQLKNTPNTSLNADGTPKKKRGRPPKPKDPNAVTTPKKRGRPKKDPSEKATPSKSPTKAGAQSPAKRQRTPKKGMKQMTLFDLKGKGKAAAKSPNKSQQKSPRKPQTPVKLPPVVTKLRKAFKIKDKSNKDRYQYSRLLTMAAEKLTKKQQAILPDDIKEVLLNKIAVIEEKKKLKKMTPEQREEYMKKKRRENAKKKAKVEDTYLPDLKPLPMPKLVHSPDGIANEFFGDMVMITEFVNCYKGLLLPEDSRVFNPSEAMKSLASGSENFLYLGQVLQVLLQTLLQDGIAQDYKELGMALANISVTPYGTAELVRLCLRDNDEESDSNSNEDSDDDDDENKNDEVPAELVEQLETTELWSMPPEEKLAILRGLCFRIMNSYSVQDYMNECQETATEQWRKRIKHGYSKSKLVKIKQNMEEEEQKQEESAEENKSGVTLKDFYGKNSVAAEEPTSDLASVVKRRRVMAARAVEEKRRRDEIERKRRDKDAEEQRKLREIENFERDFTGALNTAKLVLRQTPIGTDRDHNRYWQFLGAAPGIYVEKGWVGGEMEYHVGPKKESWESSDSDSESESESEVTRGRKPRDQTLKLEKTDEKSVPHIGQNLWFHYDNLADIQSLMDRLHTQGVRENNLLSNLKKIYPSIESDFKRIAKLKEKGEEAAEPEQVAPNLVEGMRQDLLDIEMRLRNGGLGGVDNFTDWEKNIGKAQTIQDFGALLIETQTYVPGKFLKGFLGPDGMSKPKEKSKKKKDEEENEDEEEEEHKDAEEDIHAGVERWKEAITSCVTFSRLHVLLAMLESCVKWERSMENAKCKVCRKKGDEFLLCDDCNQPFHLYCLRPALTYVPEGEWFCPGCLPVSHRKNSRNKDYRRMAEGSDNSEAGTEESEESGEEEAGEEREVDLTCAVCGGDEGLISCSSCPSSFHYECHNPPLRRAPRSIWKCQQCVTGIRLRKPKAKRPQRSARNRRAYTYDESSSSSEEEEEDDNDEQEEEDTEEEEESESNNSRSRSNVSNGTSRSRRSTTQKVIVEEDDDEDEDDESGSESEEEVVPQKSRKSKESPAAKTLQLLKTLITRICRNRNAWPFVEPVDKEEVPDYYDIVKNPISFRDMKVKIDDGDYETPQEFVDDMALLFDNADLYNKRDSVVGQCIEPLEKMYREIKDKHFPECSYWRDIGKSESETANNHYGSDTEASSEESESS